jgi:hypothetical protein
MQSWERNYFDMDKTIERMNDKLQSAGKTKSRGKVTSYFS